MLDPYKILKISRDAPDEVIRAAYKVLASKYHPDKNPGDSASARMMQHVNDAYALLSDPDRRRKYDSDSPNQEDSRSTGHSREHTQRITIHCRHCGSALRIAPEVLSAPEHFNVTCPTCRQNPFARPAARPPPPPAEPPKIVIACKHCGQSIRVLALAVHQPDLYHVTCPSCNKFPIPTRSEYRYVQTPGHDSSAKFSNITSAISNFFSEFWGFIVVGTKALFVVFILLGFIGAVIDKAKTKSSNDNVTSNNSSTTVATPNKSSSDGRDTLRVTNPPPRQNLPSTGATRQYTSAMGVAPLGVKTSVGLNYFIKVVNAYTDQPIIDFFVRGGDSVEALVPLGTYRIRYVVGQQWYGYTHLFGPDTSYHEADSIFTFGSDGGEISGYTITLYSVANGNLRTNKIPAAKF